MKKILIGISFAIISISSFAKETQKSANEVTTRVIGNCLLSIEEQYSKKLINLKYVRTVEIIKKDQVFYDPTALVIGMADNYNTNRQYMISYPTEEAVEKAFKEIEKEFSKCSR